MDAVLLIGMASLVVTKLVDAFRFVFDPNQTWPKVWTNIASFVLGVAVALVWQLDTVNLLLEGNSRLTGVAGQVLTGVILGAAAAGWHAPLDALSSYSHAKRNGTVIR